MVTTPDRPDAPPDGGAPADAGTAAFVAPTSSTGLQPPGTEGELQVLAERGKSIIRLDERTAAAASAFNYTLGEGDDAQPVTITAAGLRVTRAQALELQEAASRHGVYTVIEEAK